MTDAPAASRTCCSPPPSCSRRVAVVLPASPTSAQADRRLVHRVGHGHPVVHRPGRHRDPGRAATRSRSTSRRPRTSAAARRSTSPGTAPSRPAASSATRTPPTAATRSTPSSCCSAAASNRHRAEGPGRGHAGDLLDPDRRRSATSPRPRTRPSWRLDAYASAEDRAAVVGAPDPLPGRVRRRSAEPLTARWLPFRAAGGDGLLRRTRPRTPAARRWRRSPTAPRPAGCRATRRTASPARTATARPTSPSGPPPRTLAGLLGHGLLLAGRRADRRRQLRRLGHQAARGSRRRRRPARR